MGIEKIKAGVWLHFILNEHFNQIVLRGTMEFPKNVPQIQSQNKILKTRFN